MCRMQLIDIVFFVMFYLRTWNDMYSLFVLRMDNVLYLQCEGIYSAFQEGRWQCGLSGTGHSA